MANAADARQTASTRPRSSPTAPRLTSTPSTGTRGIKQYLKDGRALRVETVVNDTEDLGCRRCLVHLDELQARARAVNTKLLDTERVGRGCVLANPAFERIARPTLTEDGRRAPALRFGDPRVQALAGALCTSVLAVTGITNKSLRALMTGLLGRIDYTTNQASYDLALSQRFLPAPGRPWGQPRTRKEPQPDIPAERLECRIAAVHQEISRLTTMKTSQVAARACLRARSDVNAQADQMPIATVTWLGSITTT